MNLLVASVMEYRKERSKFAHFVFTEIAGLSALDFTKNCVTEQESGQMYPFLLVYHQPVLNCCSPQVGKDWHYHLLVSNADGVTDTVNYIKKTARNLEGETKFLQYPVLCPFSEFTSIVTDDISDIMQQHGSIFETFFSMLNGDAAKTPKRKRKQLMSPWRSSDPLWELEKNSTLHALEQRLEAIMNTPLGGAMGKVMSIMEVGHGYLSYNNHNQQIKLEIGPPNEFVCSCNECIMKSYLLQPNVLEN